MWIASTRQRGSLTKCRGLVPGWLSVSRRPRLLRLTPTRPAPDPYLSCPLSAPALLPSTRILLSSRQQSRGPSPLSSAAPRPILPHPHLAPCLAPGSRPWSANWRSPRLAPKRACSKEAVRASYVARARLRRQALGGRGSSGLRSRRCGLRRYRGARRGRPRAPRGSCR